MRSLCVYCGSSKGASDEYADAAKGLAREMARQGIALIYGGSSRGIMGVVADAHMEAGGHATGVLPRSLERKEVVHSGLSELHIVDTMHERKSLMAEMADGFIALPGGFGTLEEIVEITTWGQLKFHAKPCGLLNVANYYDGLLQYVAHAVSQRFVKPEHADALIVENDPVRLLSRFASFEPPTAEKWLD